MSQIALRWVLQKEFVSTVVIGVDNIQELEESMKTLTDFRLTQEEVIIKLSIYSSSALFLTS